MSQSGFGTSSTDFALRRRRMVDRQLRRRGIGDERVLAAMEALPREQFVPADSRHRAYRDGALPIGAGQTISQPWIVARMCSLLELEGPERVLEVGTGSGYSAAVLSRLCAHVVTVERLPELAERAAGAFARLGLRNVEARTGDGSKGAPDRAPFDAIVVTAAFEGGPPQSLLDQAVAGAPVVCPIERGGDERLVRLVDGHEQTIAPVRFVPLVEDDG